VLLGYYENTKAYHLMCVKTKKIIKSKDVVFIEGLKEIGDVLHPKKVENVVVHEIVNEEVEGEEPFIFSRDTPYWKQLENKQKMKHSRFMKWKNHIN